LKQQSPTVLAQIYDDVYQLTKGCQNFKYCINVAYNQWHILFRDVINQLVQKYPKDHKDEDNILFWTGNKMFPEAYDFDANNQTHMDFIVYFSHVWGDMIGIPMDKRYAVERRDKYKNFLERLNPPAEVVCKDVSQNPTDEKKQKKIAKYSNETSPEELIKKITNLVFINREFLTNIKPIEFEKDDDVNHHIDFVAAVANTRASNYFIESKDRMTTKSIAGKIIPAIATTTSVVSGLIGLEMYKVFYNDMLQHHKSYQTLQRFRYGSFNLAVQSFGFSESNPAKYVNIDGKHHNIWSKHVVDPDQILETLIESWAHVNVERVVDGKKQKTFMSTDFISDDNGIIYSNVIDELDEEEQFADSIKYKTFREIIANMSKTTDSKLLLGDYYFNLSLENTCNESDDELDDKSYDLNNINTDTMISVKVSIRD
jgi:ubiquitin-activating enzyme E1